MRPTAEQYQAVLKRAALCVKIIERNAPSQPKAAGRVTVLINEIGHNCDKHPEDVRDAVMKEVAKLVDRKLEHPVFQREMATYEVALKLHKLA